MSLSNRTHTLKYIWSVLLSILLIAVLIFVIVFFRDDFSGRTVAYTADSLRVTAVDSAVVLKVLSPGEAVEAIAVNVKNPSRILIETEDGYRGWVKADGLSMNRDSLPYIFTDAMAAFTEKGFEKRVIGKSLDRIQKKHSLALSIRPMFGRNFEAELPFRIYDYKNGSAVEGVKIIFVDGIAVSYQAVPMQPGKWKKSSAFPLAGVMISLGWADRAQQSITIPWSFPDTFWGGLLKIVSVILLVFISIAFLGMIPFYITRPLLDLCGKFMMVILNTLIYYLVLSYLFMWIGFSWIGLAVGVICWIRAFVIEQNAENKETAKAEKKAEAEKKAAEAAAAEAEKEKAAESESSDNNTITLNNDEESTNIPQGGS